MHFDQRYYVSILKRHFPQHFVDASVLEVGSYDVNGSVRDVFERCEYTGLDLVAGPGVDVVSPGHEYRTYKRFDTVISCECFEHNPYYLETFQNMVSRACGGGLVVFTCATEGRPEHGTTRTTPESSPGTIATGWEYYRNLTERDFATFEFRRSFAGHRFMTNSGSQDLYFVGVKYPAPDDVDERLTQVVAEVRALASVSVQCVASDSLFQNGDPSAAADGLECVATGVPPDLEAYARYKQVWFLLSAKRYLDAGGVIERLLGLGDRPEYHYQHSHFLHQTGRSEKAIAAARHAVERDSSRAEYWEHLAMLLLNAGDRAGAESAMLEAGRLTPLDGERQGRIRSLGFPLQKAVGKRVAIGEPLPYEVVFSTVKGARETGQIRLWNVEAPVAGRHRPSSDGTMTVSGWVLAQDEQDEIQLLIGTGAAIRASALTVERPDVVAAILQESPDSTCRLRCGFHQSVPVLEGFVRIGFRVGGADIWVQEFQAARQLPLLAGLSRWEFPAEAAEGVLELPGQPPVVESHALKMWQQRLAGLRAVVPAPVIVLVAPHKAAVYPDYLPAGTSLAFQRPVYRWMDVEASVVYPLEWMVSASQRRPTYEPSGALWTPYGAYVAYRALMEKLRSVLAKVPVVEESRVVWGPEGAEPVFEGRAVLRCDNGLGGVGRLKQFKHADRTLPKVLLLCDRFGFAFFDAFLAESCSDLVCVGGVELDASAALRYAPDVVVAVYGEERLARQPQEAVSLYQVIKSGIDRGAYSTAMLAQFAALPENDMEVLNAEEFADLSTVARVAAASGD